MFSRRLPKWFVIGFLMLALTGAGLLAYSYYIEPGRLVVRRAEITMDGIDAGLDGIRIVMISDIHGGSNGVTVERLSELTTLANKQEADLIVLLGDFVSENRNARPQSDHGLKMPMQQIADGIAGLRAKLGVFAVLGNHDGWFGDTRVAAELERVGFRVLQNEVAIVERNGRPVRLLGFRDHLQLSKSWAETSAYARRLLEPTGDGDIIALQHSPDIFPVVTGELSISPKLRLFLAGHTHGGQVWLPLFGRPVVPSTFGQKYAYGHTKENDVDLYVTSGVGTSILPFRFMVPPEIVMLTIKAS